MNKAHQTDRDGPIYAHKKNGMANEGLMFHQYNDNVGRNVRARILRVDTPQIAQVTASYGVQLPVRHQKIPPEWRDSHGFHG